MSSTALIKIWWIEHDVDGQVYLGPYFTELEARANNFENIHGWGSIYPETQEAILAETESCQAQPRD